MKWSWKIGKVCGVEIRLHAMLVVLFAWIVSTAFFRTGRASRAAVELLFASAVFGTILLHEFGHVLMAKRFGVRTKDITLLPIGGVARLDRIPEDPWQEFLISIAGPMVNAILAVFFFLLLVATGQLDEFSSVAFAQGDFLARMLWFNVGLVVFNLLPAFPMDGGRIFRALLAAEMDYTRATRVAAGVGKTIAATFCAIGLFRNPILLLVGIFVWIAADAEAAAVQMKTVLNEVTVARVMQSSFRALNHNDPLSSAINESFAHGQRVFPVMAEERLRGFVSRNDLFQALEDLGGGAIVADAMERRFPQCQAAERADAALARMTETDSSVIAVIENSKFIGFVTSRALVDYVRLRSACAKADAQRKRNVFAGSPASWAEEHSFALRS